MLTVDKEKVEIQLRELLLEKFQYDVNEAGSFQLADYFDSINFIVLVLVLEEAFNIKFPDEKLTIHLLTSFDYLADLIYGLLQEGEQEN